MTWLPFLVFLRDLPFFTIDLTRHTHHSAWSTMHNVICGGAKFVDSYLMILTRVGVRINVIQGDKDQIVPMECCSKLKLKAPNAEICIIPNANHGTVLFGRKKEFACSLEHIWESCCWHDVNFSGETWQFLFGVTGQIWNCSPLH